jgi:hypothetical protein
MRRAALYFRFLLLFPCFHDFWGNTIKIGDLSRKSKITLLWGRVLTDFVSVIKESTSVEADPLIT